MIRSLRQLYTHRFKSVLILAFVFTFSVHGQSQTEVVKKEIDSVAQLMFEYTNDRNYDALMDMTHPKLFDMVPKETMVSVLKSTLEGNEEFSIDIPELKPNYEVSEIYKDEENNTDYAFISYDMEMSMTFNNDSFDEETKETMVKMMKLQGMEAKFISDSTIELNMPNRITILLNDEATDGKWAMINYDSNSPLTFQLLSAQIIEKAKEYHQDLMLENKKKQ